MGSDGWGDSDDFEHFVGGGDFSGAAAELTVCPEAKQATPEAGAPASKPAILGLFGHAQPAEAAMPEIAKTRP